MGRTRTKSKKAQVATASTPAVPKSEPSIEALLEKAQVLIAQCDYDLACKFSKRILERSPSHADAKEIMGVCQLETGDLDAARQTFVTLIPPHPDAPSPPPPSAYLYLAQLSEDDPHLALQHYQSAVNVLSGQLKGKERQSERAESWDSEEKTLKDSIVRALIGMVEIWMDPSYSLCDDPAAEKTCEDLLKLALQTDKDNSEALQALSSVRLSQQRPDEAKQCLEQAWVAWKDLEPDDPHIPPIETRLNLVKLFIELELYTPAISVLQGIMATDDQEVEAWYLEGWCFYLMAEQAKDNGTTLEDVTWEELAKNARDCLEACQVLHTSQEHPDLPLLDHTRQLIQNLDELGIGPSPPDEGDDDDGDEDGEWDDESDDDIDMRH